MFLFPDTTVLVNLAFISRMDLLDQLCANGRGRWVDRVHGETSIWRERPETKSIAYADQVFGSPTVLTRAQNQDALALRLRMAKLGDPEERHLGEAQTIVVARDAAMTLAPGERRVKFVTDDYDAAAWASKDGLLVLGTGDVLSLLCKEPADQAEKYYKQLRSGQHHPAWHQLRAPDWAKQGRRHRNR